MELKKAGKKYHLELDFDELEVFYHALVIYSEGIRNIVFMPLGMILTDVQVDYWRKADELIKNMETNELKLYYCLGFEGEGLPSAGEEK